MGKVNNVIEARRVRYVWIEGEGGDEVIRFVFFILRRKLNVMFR